jgi:hypothetical protein
MTVTPQLLAQQRATTIATSVYQPAANLIGVIKQLNVANTTGTNTTYQLFLDIDGVVYDEDSALFWDIAIAGNTTDTFLVWLPLGTVGSLAILASANDRLTVTVGGYEIVRDEVFGERPLGQTRPPTLNTPVSIFSPVNGVRAVTRSLFISNVAAGGKAAKYSVYLDHDGATFDDTTALARSVSLNAGTTDIFPLWLPMDNAAGNLAVETNDVANELNFTLFGFLEPK